MRIPSLCLILLPCILSFRYCQALSLSSRRTGGWLRELRNGYELRQAADPAFLPKSIAEVILAATTQITAEYERRGGEGILLEMDFVIAGVATAIFGKYMSAWKTAPTRQTKHSDINYSTDDAMATPEPHFRSLPIPTNAFQKFMLDGVTRPTLQQRMASLVAPCLPLFRAGAMASLVGYGMTAIMVHCRAYWMPSYVAATRSVNLVHACLYTGTFMAIVSNLRYQLLQGVIEPFLDASLRRIPILRAGAIFVVRVANGILGSMLAITGMQLLGLQRLK